MRATTVNTYNNNPNPSATANTTAVLSDVIGWQELTSARHREAVDNLSAFHTFWPGSVVAEADDQKNRKQWGSAANAVAISWRKTMYRMAGGGVRWAHDAKAGDTPYRFVSWVLLLDNQGIYWLVTNGHPAEKGGWAGAAELPGHRALWLRWEAALLRVLGDHHPIGGRVVILGDMNRREWAPKYAKVAAVHILDYVLVAGDISVGKVSTQKLNNTDPAGHRAVTAVLEAEGSDMIRSTEAAIAVVQDQSRTGPQFAVGMCQRECRKAFNAPGGANSAAIAWAEADYRHKTTDLKAPPRGTLVYWTGGSKGYGHVAISAGNGKCWSTDIKRSGYFDLVDISYITKAWPSMKLVGWAEDTNGVRIWMPTTPVKRPTLFPTSPTLLAAYIGIVAANKGVIAVRNANAKLGKADNVNKLNAVINHLSDAQRGLDAFK